MRHSGVKLIGLLAALMIALTGCNLIGVDQMKQLDLDFAALDKDYSTVVARYDGGEITKGAALPNFVSLYSYYTQLYSMFGTSIGTDMINSIKNQALQQSVQNVAIAKECDARGLTLSDEKLAEIQSTADANYQQAYDSFFAQAAGKGEIKARQAEYDMYANGYSKQSFYDSELAQAKHELLEENLKAEVSELTDEQLQAAYDEKVSDDQEAYADDPGAFESAMTDADENVAWMPEGYRTVKHILVKPDEALLTAVNNARNALSDAEDSLKDYEAEQAGTAETDQDDEPRTAEEIQADIDETKSEIEKAQADVQTAEAAVLDSVKAKTDEIYAKLAEGVAFADLIAEYGEDPGMQNEPTATRGYYVSAQSENWDKNFTAGAMALQNVGDVSQSPVISTSGVHIIRYESDVTPGAVPLENIRDAIYNSTLENAQSEHEQEVLEKLTAALNPVYFADAFTIG